MSYMSLCVGLESANCLLMLGHLHAFFLDVYLQVYDAAQQISECSTAYCSVQLMGSLQRAMKSVDVTISYGYHCLKC